VNIFAISGSSNRPQYY